MGEGDFRGTGMGFRPGLAPWIPALQRKPLLSTAPTSGPLHMLQLAPSNTSGATFP